MYARSIVGLRRDLRLTDHAARFEAARRSDELVLAFVLDPPLSRGPRVGAPIVQFFFDSLGVLREQLRAAGSDLALLEGDFGCELAELADRDAAQAVFYNLDYDPAVRARDERVVGKLRERGLDVYDFVDHVYAAADEIVQQSGKPYTVYTPYRKRWQAAFTDHPRAPFKSETAARGKFMAAGAIGATKTIPKPENYGHASSKRFPAGGFVAAQRLLDAFVAGGIDGYLDRRNLPAVAGTSGLSPHLRAGTIGIRSCVAAARSVRAKRSARAASNVEGWIGELVWRDFYQALLIHFPRVAYEPFIEAGKAIAYVRDDAGYAAWCDSTQHHGLDAQSAAHDRRVVPHQTPAGRLSRRRTVFRAAPRRR